MPARRSEPVFLNERRNTSRATVPAGKLTLVRPSFTFANLSNLGMFSLRLTCMSSSLQTRDSLPSCLYTSRNRNWGPARRSAEARRSSSSKADRPAAFIGDTRGSSVPRALTPCWLGMRTSRPLPRRPLRNGPSLSGATREASAGPHRDDRSPVTGLLMKTTTSRTRHTIPQRPSASEAQGTNKTCRDVHLQVGDFRQISRSTHNEAYRLPSRPLAQARRASTTGSNNLGTMTGIS